MNPNDALKAAKDALDRAISEKKLTQDFVRSIGPAIAEQLKQNSDSLIPLLREIATNSKLSQADLQKAISSIVIPKTEIPPVNVSMSDIKPPIVNIPAPIVNVPEAIVNVKVPDFPKIPPFPEIKIPAIKVPKPEVTVNFDASKIKIPPFPTEMSISGWVSLMGFDKGFLSNPLPVQLRDANGKPVSFGANVVSGGGGGNAVIINDANHPVPVSGTFSASFSGSTLSANMVNTEGLAYNSDNPLPITGSLSTTPGATFFASDAVLSVNVIQSLGSNTVVGSGYQDNALRVVNATDAVTSVNVTNASLAVTGTFFQTTQPVSIASPVAQGDSASALRIIQAGDSVSSVYVNNPVAQGDAATALRVVIAGNSDASVTATQGGTWNIGTVTTVTGITNSTSAALVDSTGVQFSGSNPLPITGTVTVSGSPTSVISVGSVVSDGIDDGSAPLKTGGIARTANPSAVSGGDTITFSADKIGRQLTRSLQVRDLLQTAYAQLTNGTETTLLAGVASTFLDLVYLLGANNSDAAVSVDIRSGTANGVLMTLEIPAYGTSGVSLQATPIPQDVAANAWTADMPDITGTTVSLSALFSKEI